MLHNVDLILTLAGGLSAALVLGFITQKLRMSPIVGYLLAGIIVGPYSPGFVADADTASQCAEIGIILLIPLSVVLLISAVFPKGGTKV